MEINDPTADPGDLWQVTTGLLVIEMVEGAVQTGDDEFDWSPEPAEIPIAGDIDVIPGMTYARINELNLREVSGREEGTLINEAVREDEIVVDQQYDQYGVTAAYNVEIEGINNTVASPFWGFMNEQDLVYQDGEYVTDDLFLNPFYATGYPITEAHWTTVNVQGYPQDVLWQCFERRCLTYTPANESGWQVETGNVGQHYFHWRYGSQGPAMEAVDLAYVAIGDGGVLVIEIGCEDSLVTVEAEIQQLDSVEHQIQAALQKLFVTEHEQWSNTLYGQSVMVASVIVENGTATIRLDGQLLSDGVCDDPRIEEPIRATATQFSGVDDVQILLNGSPWEMGEQGQ
jgi:hypothetical protein